MFGIKRKLPMLGGALLCASAAEEYIPPSGPLRQGADISWLSGKDGRGIRIGDNQGQTSACVTFTLGKWEEIMTDRFIADTTCVQVWINALEAAGRKDGGLHVKEGFRAGKRAGWFKSFHDVVPATVADLVGQPLIAVYDNDVFTRVNPIGCLSNKTLLRKKEWHCVLLAAHGNINGVTGGPYCYQFGSWGQRYGHKGCTFMPEWRHKQACRELWKLV